MKATMSTSLLQIERLTNVDDRLATELNPLFDEGVTWDPTYGRRFLDDPDRLVLLARWDGQACGFAYAYCLPRFDRRRSEVELYELGVDEAYRRRGIARALIAAVLDWARERQASEVWDLTETDNLPARATYTSTGGQESPNSIVMYTYSLTD